MDVPKVAGDEQIVYSGRIFEIVKQPMKIGAKVVDFEIVRRSPGVRLLVVRDGNILLVKEFRAEHEGFDYRLPGGKVFDSLKDYKKTLDGGKDILKYAVEAARKECLEETGISVKMIEHVHTARCGASVSWDMYYFLVDDFDEKEDGQNLEDGEVIYPEWKTFDEAKQLCLKGDVKEDRTVGVLLRFLLGWRKD